MLASESVIRKWDMCNTDISKAFLQGVTYKELAAATGEPLREVNFTLPAYANAFIRELPGWEDFDPATEVIHCDKPGTGCNDAPRCFSMKLAQITQDEIGMKPCTVDNELCILHESNSADAKKSKYGRKLVCVMAKHVDDLKLCGEYNVIVDVLAKIQKVFGELKIEWNNFTNCGVRHRQDTTTKEVTLDQDDYIFYITAAGSDEVLFTSASIPFSYSSQNIMVIKNLVMMRNQRIVKTIKDYLLIITYAQIQGKFS